MRIKQSGTSVPVDQFFCQVDRSAGDSLGIDVNHSDRQTLLITSVDDTGLVGTWNATNLPANHVGAGDRIVAVNGLSGDAFILKEECRQHKVLQLAIKRPPEAFFDSGTLLYYDCGD